MMMNWDQRTNEHVDLSVIVPVGNRVDDLDELHRSYVRGLDELGLRYELVYVIDGPRQAERATLVRSGASAKIVQLNRAFGEASALMAGFAHCRGAQILTLPAYFQIEAEDIRKLVAAGEGVDFIVACRSPRRGGWFERARRQGFHKLLRFVTGSVFRDLGCSVRLFDRRVLEEITVYGDQHRLLPLLAANQGFTVREVEVRQSPRDDFRGNYRVRDYVHRALDLFTVFFLVRFTKKPLRFFGMIGSALVGLAVIFLAVLLAQRLLFNDALADRPALLLTSLMLVVGVQIFALGLLGELIIFTHARDLREYKVAEIVDVGNSAPAAPEQRKPSYVPRSSSG
jgi:glycosyltransferase involved in cell wall biosynthesis